MKSGVKGLVLILMGLFLYSRFFSGKLLFYINERFIWLTVLAAIGFILVGVSYRYRSSHAHQHHHPGHEHGHLSWAGLFLVLLPIVLGLLVPPKPLGAAAMRNRDLNAETLTSAAGPESSNILLNPGQERNILDWLVAFRAAPDPAAFTGQEARVIGFVYRNENFPDDMFMVSRFVISCCAADAVPFGLMVEWPESSSLADDQWVEVAGHFEAGRFNGEEMPILIPDTVTPTDIPNQPYLYPY